MFNDEKKINLFMILILIIGLIYIIINSIYETLREKVIIEVETNSESNIKIKVGNYEDNMEEVIESIKSTDKDSVFVIGINDEVNGARSQKSGIHKAVIDKFYNNEERFRQLESKTKEAFNKNNNGKNNFGKIGLVKHDNNSKIMFAINSQNS